MPRWDCAAIAEAATRYVDGLIETRAKGGSEAAAAFRFGALLWAEHVASILTIDAWLEMVRQAAELSDRPNKVTSILETLFDGIVLADGSRVLR